jgi:hypothetical protein
MTNRGRIMTFLAIVLSVWSAMHLYVVSRLWNLPTVPGPLWHHTVAIAAVLLWLNVPLGRWLARSVGRIAVPIELVGSTWIGVLFLLSVCLLAADLATGFGYLLPAGSRIARALAVWAAASLSLLALVQGLRSPEVRRHTVAVRGLRPELSGLRLVQLSDLHIGPLLRGRWIRARLAQVAALRPDLVVVTGDLVDQDAGLVDALVPALRRLHAPLGVWGVTGNHEFYAGLDRSVRVFEGAGIRLLRDAATEVAPGLVLAGVDDLTARRQFGSYDHAVDRTLARRPPGTTVFLSHSPWQVERAAALGVDLMLSGHTHSGQIWPFAYLVRLTYPYVAGRFGVNGMTLIVSRGTGFWGPPMRLFQRAEVTLVTLEAGREGPP